MVEAANVAVAPVAPTTQAPAAPVAPAPETGSKLEAELKAVRDREAQRTREHLIERRKWEASNRANREKLSKLEQYEKTQALARMNPPEFLKGIYGDNWYDKVVESKLNGVPPADLIAAELSKMEEKFESKLKERDTQAKSTLEEQQKQQLEQARRGLHGEARDFYAASGNEYPILERLGDADAVARVIAQRVESEWKKTAQFDESGRLTRQGRALTAKEAADLVEADLLGFVEAASKHDKYKAKFAPLPPAKESGTVGESKSQQGKSQSGLSQPRRTLSNDITGSTQERKPATSLKEKRERAIAAFTTARKRS